MSQARPHPFKTPENGLDYCAHKESGQYPCGLPESTHKRWEREAKVKTSSDPENK